MFIYVVVININVVYWRRLVQNLLVNVMDRLKLNNNDDHNDDKDDNDDRYCRNNFSLI